MMLSLTGDANAQHRCPIHISQCQMRNRKNSLEIVVIVDSRAKGKVLVLPCRVCPYPVPPERLDRWPWAITCSPECSTRNESTARHRKDRASDRTPMHSWMLRYVHRTGNRTAHHFTCHCGAGQIRITRHGEHFARWKHYTDEGGFIC